MQENTKTDDAPLDLSAFDDEPSAPAATQALARIDVASGVIIESMPRPVRLVEISSLSTDDLAEARCKAASISFRDTLSLLEHGNGSLAGLALVSRRLLADRTVGEQGEVGAIAAAVLDGIKVLRLEDLQREEAPAKGGFLSRIVGVAHDAASALKGFAENRRRFLSVMDRQEARARTAKATLSTDVALLDQMSAEARAGVHALKIDIAAAQIALDRACGEEEALRAKAMSTGDAADAAEVMDYRASIANFQGKAMELRTSLIRSATLVPTIAATRRAAETRIMKISNGLLVVIPSLMAAAAVAGAQADIRLAQAEGDSLAEADRRVGELAARGAHDVAVSSARSLAVDPRNIKALADAAAQAVDTLAEVVRVEREVEVANRDAEAKLVEIRDGLVTGMRGVQRAALPR